MNKSRTELFSYKNLVLVFVTIFCFLMLLILPPISQDPAYHIFADQRTIVSIPNFFNVFSNLPFVLLGIIGLFNFLKRGTTRDISDFTYILFLLATIGVGLGSAYYHYGPENNTLIYDRLPMTIAFMSFLSITIYLIVSKRLGRILLIPFLLMGIISVLYWYFGEQKGNGDLRFYVLIQFYPMIAIPLIVFLYPTSRELKQGLLWAIGFYALAKGFEMFDKKIYLLGHILSGHTLKHLAASLAIFKIIQLISSILQPREKPAIIKN